MLQLLFPKLFLKIILFQLCLCEKRQINFVQIGQNLNAAPIFHLYWNVHTEKLILCAFVARKQLISFSNLITKLNFYIICQIELSYRCRHLEQASIKFFFVERSFEFRYKLSISLVFSCMQATCSTAAKYALK